MTEHAFDVVVIGAGPAGEVLAGRITERSDKTVAIVEDDLVGGECSYYACMPSKALLRPQEALREVNRIPGAAEAVSGTLPDASAVLNRRDEVIHELSDDGQLPWLDSRGIQLFRGVGTITDERRVEVEDQVLHARDAVVIATGTGAMVPPIPGLAEAAWWSNREMTTTREVPDRLLVLGGGVVGVEMAQAWRSLGSEVAVIEAMDRMLGREEPFAGEELAAAFEELGIDVYTGAKAIEVHQNGETVRVELEGGTRLDADRLLLAIGRRPRTERIGVESLGLEPGGFIEVDERLRVPGHPWLYAVGDVNGRSLLTHMGKYQARIAADAIIGADGAVARADDLGSPRVVFTDPQMAAAGHTLASAQEAGIDARAVDLPTAGTAGASFYGRNAPGTTRFVIDTDRDVLVGATFVGPEVADMLQAATIAIVGEVPLDTIVHAVPSFPTRSELWLNLMEALGK